MIPPSNPVLPHNQTTEANFIRRHQVTLTTLAALIALVTGATALRLWVALNHMM